MKKKTPFKRRVNITVDLVQHEILKKRLLEQRRSLSTELNTILTFLNRNNLTTDQLLKI